MLRWTIISTGRIGPAIAATARKTVLTIASSWRRSWAAAIPFFAFPAEVRPIIYTTNAIEGLNAKLRWAVRARGHFPTDESAIKLLCLVLRQTQKERKVPPREWGMAKGQLAILFEGRFRPV